MRQVLLVVLGLALIAVPAVAQKAYIDYDSSVDFEALKTFAWKETGKPSLEDADPLMHRYIVDAIVRELKSAGLEQVDSSPDFFVTYHGESETQYSVDTTSYGYGYGRGWRWGGYGYLRAIDVDGAQLRQGYSHHRRLEWRQEGTDLARQRHHDLVRQSRQGAQEGRQDDRQDRQEVGQGVSQGQVELVVRVAA